MVKPDQKSAVWS